MRRLPCLVLVAGLLAGCSSHAPRDAPAEVAEGSAASIPEATEDRDPIVCKSVVPTGSRIASKSCMRRSEREAMRRSSQDGTNAAQRSGAQNGNPTGN